MGAGSLVSRLFSRLLGAGAGVLGSREACRPVLKNPKLIVAGVQRIVEESTARGVFRRPTEAQLLLFVDHEGKVRYVEVQQGTGDDWMDEELEELGYRLRWIPARINGTPVAVWVEQPIRF